MLSHCCQVPEAFPETSVQNGFLDENLCYKCMLDITMKHLVEQFSFHFAFWDNLQISKPSFKWQSRKSLARSTSNKTVTMVGIKYIMLTVR